jgi:hypothetical protein
MCLFFPLCTGSSGSHDIYTYANSARAERKPQHTPGGRQLIENGRLHAGWRGASTSLCSSSACRRGGHSCESPTPNSALLHTYPHHSSLLARL